MRDTIGYLAPGWIFEPMINKLFVEKDLITIFNYGLNAMAEHLKIEKIITEVGIVKGGLKKS